MKIDCHFDNEKVQSNKIVKSFAWSKDQLMQVNGVAESLRSSKIKYNYNSLSFHNIFKLV